MEAMKKILVVDDDPVVGKSFDRVLTRKGYAVITATNGPDALEKLRNERYDMVFTDIKMPGSLCGLRLVKAIQDRWPPNLLIVASGLKVPAEDEFPRMARFIRKPYAPKQVLKVLDDLFGPNPAPYRYYNDVIQNYGHVA
jgi:CheY-like chemotaxis protein